MLRCSKARCTSREVGYIVVLFVPDSGKVYNLNLIPNTTRWGTKDVVYLNVPIGDLLVVHVLNTFANFQKDDASDVVEVCGVVFMGNVADYFLISVVPQFELVPVHDLS